MKKKYGFMLAVAVLLAGCGQKKETSVITARPVKTTIVESRSIIRKDFSGIVEAVEYVKLAFRVSGQIINLPVIEGEKVKKPARMLPDCYFNPLPRKEGDLRKSHESGSNLYISIHSLVKRETDVPQ